MTTPTTKNTRPPCVKTQMASHWLKWALLGLSLQTTAQAEVADKVAADVALYQDFLATSEAIEQGTNGDFVTMGDDAFCDFDATLFNIQQLIIAGHTEIRLASNATYIENIALHDQNLILRGGFADCQAAENNEQVYSDLTQITATALGLPVLRVTGDEERRLLRLENLQLRMGTSSSINGLGGGLSVDEAPYDVQLLRVSITENSGSSGAGVVFDSGTGINSTQINVFGQDVLIHHNQATGFGGGLYCVGLSQIALTGMSLFYNNEAGYGAGVYMRNGCALSLYPGATPESLIFYSGFFANESTQNGGAAYLSLGAELYLFGQTMCHEGTCLGSDDIPAVMINNAADVDENGTGSGGGIYLNESNFHTSVYASGLYAEGNLTPGSGGAFYQGGNTTLTIERRDGPCWDDRACNTFSGNQSLGEGGAFFAAGGQLNLSHLNITESRSNAATVLAVRGEETVATLENAVLFNNGDDGNGMFADVHAVLVDEGASLTMTHNSMVDNHITSSLFRVGTAAATQLTLNASLVQDQATTNLFLPVTGTVNIDCLLTHESASFSGLNVTVDTPIFTDRPNGDLHLQPGSPGIDLCQAFPVSNPKDIDGETRGWDDPTANNTNGIYDAGADEGLLSDVIFENDFDTPTP
jgi:predicted outer membrane repeat protein